MENLIFIVDDEPSILKLISHWVKNQWNDDVKTFTNGRDMLNDFSENPDFADAVTAASTSVSEKETPTARPPALTPKVWAMALVLSLRCLKPDK